MGLLKASHLTRIARHTATHVLGANKAHNVVNYIGLRERVSERSILGSACSQQRVCSLKSFESTMIISNILLELVASLHEHTLAR